MAFQKDSQDPNFQALLGPLNVSGLKTKDNPTYQVLVNLIKYLTQFKNNTSSSITNINNQITGGSSSSGSGGGSGGGSGVSNTLTFLTANDESIPLPFSRELLAGTGISFDDSITNKRTINTSAPLADFVVVSDGGSSPLTIDDGAGNFIYIPYTA